VYVACLVLEKRMCVTNAKVKIAFMLRGKYLKNKKKEAYSKSTGSFY